jgi:23S rRNA-/tRNA-specific pseudouridylate synthase
MVEHATGVNLWSEWAKLEMCRTEGGYQLPPLKQRFGGVVTSLARQETPDTSGFTDPEIVHRLDMKHHIGFVVAADSPQRVEELLTQYMDRIARDFHAALPGADKAGH